MIGPDADLPGVLEDEPELGVLLDDRDDPPAHLVGQHRHLDELSVLEPVADDRRFVGRHRDHGQQLRLGAGLEAEVVGTPEIEHLLDDLTLLVHLDRIDAAVAPLVLVLRDGRLEGRVDVGDALAEDVLEADQDGQPDASELQVIDELLQVNRALGILRRVHADVAVRADGEVAFSPSIDLIQLGRVRNRPGIALTPRARYTTRRAHEAQS